MTSDTNGQTVVASLVSRRRVLNVLLDGVERAGNSLPDQVTMFLALSVITALGSWVARATDWTARHPVTGETVGAFNLISREGLQWILATVVPNFTGFAPLGTVLVALVGVGVAERTGLFAALLKAVATAVPSQLVTPAVIFAGVMSNVASDAGYVILPPLAAALYVSLGRHPLAGIAAAFAGIAGGFSANLLLGPLDPLLAGLTEQAARLFDAGYTVHAACNYFFMVVSVPVLTALGWVVAVRVVEPRLGKWTAGHDRPEPGGPAMGGLSRIERRGLWVAGATFVGCVALLLVAVVPGDGVLRDAAATGIGRYGPFFSSLVGLIMLTFLLPGIAYGLVTGQIRSDHEVAKMMGATMSTMGNYIVMAFFAGQFIAWFGKSGLGLLVAIKGAELLEAVHLTGPPLMALFVLAAAGMNLFMVSASAKWAIIAPIFVPMFMALGMSPEATQVLFRVGDSVTNVATPLNVYLPLLMATTHRYMPAAGVGTLIAAMVPYCAVFLLVWTSMVVAWIALGWPLGPGAPLAYGAAG